MRARALYPVDSPQAAGRVLALALLADGEACGAERQLLQAVQAAATLGLQAHQWHALVEELEVEIAAHRGARWAHPCQVAPWLMSSLFDAVVDAALRRRVLRLCALVVEADGRIDAGECLVLTAAVEHWGLHGVLMQPQAA